MDDSLLIVGAGQAAAQLVASLRSEGYAGRIVLAGEEPYLPYQRPPLSKAFLAGELARERLFIKPEGFYAEARCELLLGTRVLTLDRANRTAGLDGGRTLSWTTLVFATGSRVRPLPVQGAELPGCFYLRGIDDVERLQDRIVQGKRLAVIGAGYIGLEVAAVARKRGMQVCVIEALPRVMARSASPQISEFYSGVHAAAGVDVRCGQKLEKIEQENGALSVVTGAGRVSADTVLIGIGILPNVELAREAGLEIANGIVVDAHARTSDPSLYAIGDCASLPTSYSLAGRTRLESVQNAIDQAKHAALAICGRPKVYDEVPWFWSDQYHLKLQIAGLAAPGDATVLRGDPASGSFAVFHLRDGAVAAVEAVNAAPEYMMGRRLIAARARPAPERLADKAVPMKDMA